jgi:CheY-like chemotaxis protein
LSNAVKYNVSDGSVSVTAADIGDYLGIGITDTGPGIPDDKIPLLFTPFERLGADATGVEGTGLGLALSKSLVEAMGGRLRVDTMAGQGTTFWVELNQTEGPLEDETSDEEIIRPASTGARILYIEDNLSNLKLIERLLVQTKGLEVISAMTGTLGLEMAQQHVPDLILLDLHLPDVSGDEILVRLRKDPRTRPIPVVILSADATPGQIKRLRSAGADEYVTKPIDVTEFLAVVERFLKPA